jgi:hypothetical protein
MGAPSYIFAALSIYGGEDPFHHRQSAGTEEEAAQVVIAGTALEASAKMTGSRCMLPDRWILTVR